MWVIQSYVLVWQVIDLADFQIASVFQVQPWLCGLWTKEKVVPVSNTQHNCLSCFGMKWMAIQCELI